MQTPIADVTIPQFFLDRLAKRGRGPLGYTAEQAAREYAGMRTLAAAVRYYRNDIVSVDNVANVIRIVADTGNDWFWSYTMAAVVAAEAGAKSPRVDRINEPLDPFWAVERGSDLDTSPPPGMYPGLGQPPK